MTTLRHIVSITSSGLYISKGKSVLVGYSYVLTSICNDGTIWSRVMSSFDEVKSKQWEQIEGVPKK